MAVIVVDMKRPACEEYLDPWTLWSRLITSKLLASNVVVTSGHLDYSWVWGASSQVVQGHLAPPLFFVPFRSSYIVSDFFFCIFPTFLRDLDIR